MEAVGWVLLHGSVVHGDVHGETMLWVTTDSVTFVNTYVPQVRIGISAPE